MTENETITKNEIITVNNRLFQKVDKTLYEICVQLAENAKESVQDALVRLVAAEINSESKEEEDE